MVWLEEFRNISAVASGGRVLCAVQGCSPWRLLGATNSAL